MKIKTNAYYLVCESRTNIIKDDIYIYIIHTCICSWANVLCRCWAETERLPGGASGLGPAGRLLMGGRLWPLSTIREPGGDKQTIKKEITYGIIYPQSFAFSLCSSQKRTSRVAVYIHCCSEVERADLRSARRFDPLLPESKCQSVVGQEPQVQPCGRDPSGHLEKLLPGVREISLPQE